MSATERARLEGRGRFPRKPGVHLAFGPSRPMIAAMTEPQSLSDAFARSLVGDALFDAVPDTVYFLKDAGGRYVAVNQTLVERTGRTSKADLLGRTADEVFPGELGRRIAAQDRTIMTTGRLLAAELELHLYAGGREGWCLTWKSPLRATAGGIVGLFGMSRDLVSGRDATAETRGLSEALAYARDHLDEPLRIADLATRAGLSAFQFDQRVRAIFGMSAGQYVTRLRIDRARDLLRNGSEPIAEIALICGYADQTAFTRQFRKIVQLTPQRYRALRD